MKNHSSSNQDYRFKAAYVSMLGTTQLHLRNPYIVAWWSAAFPGLGHMLLAKNLRGFILFVWEILVNFMSKLNLGIIYSFIGQFDRVVDVLEPRWLLLYLPVYIFGIWDSYRTTVDLNKVYLLAEHENAKFTSFNIGALEINYLDKRRPGMAVLWSLLTPGLGQLYIHRVLVFIFLTTAFIVFVYLSRFLIAVHHLFLGEIQEATNVIEPFWLLMLPSMYGFAMYDSYVNTVENNKLFENDQRNFLKENYQSYRVQSPSGQERH